MGVFAERSMVTEGVRAEAGVPERISVIVADLQRLMLELDQLVSTASFEASIDLYNAMHAIHRAIVAATELDLCSYAPCAEQWIG
jgi:hypothetical protein